MIWRRMGVIARHITLPTSRAGAYGLIVTLALLVRLAALLLYGIDQVGDSPEYDRIAINLAQGHGYSLELTAPFTWSTHREPGFPLFLALVYFVFGHSPLAGVLAQCLLSTAACLLIYETAQLMFEDRRIALWAALANAAYVPIAIFAVRLISETVALTAMIAVAYLLVRLVTRPTSWTAAAMLGAAMGYLALTKLIFVLLPGALVPLLVLTAKGRRWQTIQSGAVALAAMAIVLMPWAAVNYSLHGTFSSGNSVRMAANIYCRIQDNGMKGGPGTYLPMLEMEKNGVPTETINKIYQQKFWQIIREHPFRYAAGMLLEIRDLWRFGLSEDEIDPSGPMVLHGAKGALTFIVKYLFQAINIVVLITGLLGFFVARSSRTGLVMAVIGYSTLMFSVISCALPRHNVPVLQLMLIFSAAFIVRILFRQRAGPA